MAQDVMVKLEPLKSSQHLLKHKHQVLSGVIGILCVHWFGTEGSFNAMVLNCLGQSLEDLFTLCHYKFMVQTVLVLGEQLVWMFLFK